MSKSPAMVALLDELTELTFGRTLTSALTNHSCVKCGGVAAEFRDKLSEREYRISGLCQPCQDATFDDVHDLY